MNHIALLSERLVFIPTASKMDVNTLGVPFNGWLMQQGYILSPEALSALTRLPKALAMDTITSIMKVVKEIKGSDRTYAPMYPNFPKQVEMASGFELYSNAIFHYMTFGEWLPSYEKEVRESHFPTKFVELGFVDETGVKDFLKRILEANVALAPQMLDFVQLNKSLLADMKFYVPFKETLAFLSKLDSKIGFNSCATATDVLRVASALSNGDFTLAENTKFNLDKTAKDAMADRLNYLIVKNELEVSEDIAKYGKRWQKLFHHIGVHKNYASFKGLCKMASKNYGLKLKSFDSKLRKAIVEKDFDSMKELYGRKPGYFARGLNELISLYPIYMPTILKMMEGFAPSISDKVLWQLRQYFANRNNGKRRIVRVKTGRTKVVNALSNMRNDIPTKMVDAIDAYFKTKNADKPAVRIDESLKNIPLPLNVRNAGIGNLIPIGTRIKMPQDAILRFGIHWFGNDIDLSVVKFDSYMNYVGHVSYTNLKSDGIVHSGDITYAPEPSGACEFIDVNPKEISRNCKYIGVFVNLFKGTNFVDMKSTFNIQILSDDYDDTNLRNLAMTGECFEASRVAYKIALTTKSKQCVMALYDLDDNSIIWCDIDGTTMNNYSTVESTKATVTELLDIVVNTKYASVYDLYATYPQTDDENVELLTFDNMAHKVSEVMALL